MQEKYARSHSKMSKEDQRKLTNLKKKEKYDDNFTKFTIHFIDI